MQLVTNLKRRLDTVALILQMAFAEQDPAIIQEEQKLSCNIGVGFDEFPLGRKPKDFGSCGALLRHGRDLPMPISLAPGPAVRIRLRT